MQRVAHVTLTAWSMDGIHDLILRERTLLEVVPILGASTSSSGLAMVAAGAFGDADLAAGLRRSLGLFMDADADPAARRLATGTGVGEAAILYALVQGPLWGRVVGAP